MNLLNINLKTKVNVSSNNCVNKKNETKQQFLY